MLLPCLGFAFLDHVYTEGSNFVVERDQLLEDSVFIDLLVCSTDDVLNDSFKLATFEIYASSDLGYYGNFRKGDQKVEVAGMPKASSFAIADGAITEYDSYPDALIDSSTRHMGSAKPVLKRILNLSYLREGLLESNVVHYECKQGLVSVEIYSYAAFSDYIVYLHGEKPPSEECSAIHLSFKLLHTGERLKQGLLDSYRKEILLVNPQIENEALQIEVSKYRNSAEFLDTFGLLSEKLEGSSKNIIVTQYSRFDCLGVKSFMEVLSNVQ